MRRGFLCHTRRHGRLDTARGPRVLGSYRSTNCAPPADGSEGSTGSNTAAGGGRGRSSSTFAIYDWETERQNLLGAYYRRLCSDDPEVANAAARAFVRYELSIR